MREAFVVIDLEGTSKDPSESHIIEWAEIVVAPAWFDEPALVCISGMVRPPIPIPPETSAIHHIIDSDVMGAPTIDQAKADIVAELIIPGRVAVAHNADYERTVLERTCGLPAVMWICTYKVALRVWPEAPSHSNESLRYWLRLDESRGRTSAQHPHTAKHDATVTAALLNRLLSVGTSVPDMLMWTAEPALLPRCPIGDWRGQKWTDVDSGFLDWILYKIHDRPDLRFCAQHELKRREDERVADAFESVDNDDNARPF